MGSDVGEQVAFFSKGLFTKELRTHKRSLTSLQKLLTITRLGWAKSKSQKDAANDRSEVY